MSASRSTESAVNQVDMSEDAERIYSDQQYLQNNPNWHLEDTVWKAKNIDEILKGNGVYWQSAVEVGCGSGGIVAELAKRYADRDVAGYDIAEDAAAFWTQHKAENARFMREDFLEESASFDVLMLIDVFEHVEDYMGFLRKLSPRAKHHVFHIPLDLHVQGLMRNSHMRARDVVGHLHYFSRDSALATLRDTGYDVIDWRYTDVAREANKSTRRLRTKLLNPIRAGLGALAPNTAATLLGGYSLMVLCRPTPVVYGD